MYSFVLWHPLVYVVFVKHHLISSLIFKDTKDSNISMFFFCLAAHMVHTPKYSEPAQHFSFVETGTASDLPCFSSTPNVGSLPGNPVAKFLKKKSLPHLVSIIIIKQLKK